MGEDPHTDQAVLKPARPSLGDSTVRGFFTYWGSPSYFRFVGRARSAGPRWPTYQVIGATFRETCLDDHSKEPWINEQRASLDELHRHCWVAGPAPAHLPVLRA